MQLNFLGNDIVWRQVGAFTEAIDDRLDKIEIAHRVQIAKSLCLAQDYPFLGVRQFLPIPRRPARRDILIGRALNTYFGRLDLRWQEFDFELL